jgi:hypothetical protein
MDSKHKAGQKAGEAFPKQQRPGTEQVRSGVNIQKGEGEAVRAPKEVGQQKQKQERGKTK